jgi:hypothetical protein
MTLATIPPDHITTKLDHHHGGQHYAIWYGRAKPHHNRPGQSFVVSSAGTEVFSFEFIDAPEGTRVKYRLGFPGNAISAMAIDLQPVEPPVVIKDEVEPVDDKRAAGSPWKRKK